MSERLLPDVPMSDNFVPEENAHLTASQVDEVAEFVEHKIIHSREDVPENVDCLVILGKNLGQGIWDKQMVQEIPYHLSLDSKINTRAAGELWRPGRKILLSGGKTIGQDFLSQPEAAKTFLMDVYQNIPEDDIYIDNQGFDTAKSAEYLERLAERGSFKHFGIVTTSFHLLYAYPLFRQFGSPDLALIASEDIVGEIDDHFARIIKVWADSKRVGNEVEYARYERLPKVLTTDVRGAQTRQRTEVRLKG